MSSESAEDRISQLPDSLICHILSFVPTKHAITTSFLSKRWTSLWQSVLTLDFDDESFIDFNSFSSFMYSVIVWRDPTLPLRSFRLKYVDHSDFKARDVTLFLLAVVQGIESFDLHVPNRNLLDGTYFGDVLMELVPSVLRVLNCKTLVVLKLKNLILFDVHSLVDLPLLKTLHLNSIYFMDPLENFMNLIRGCPNLEDWHTDNVELGQSYWFIDWEIEPIGFPKLVRANFSNIQHNFPFAWLRNARFLRVLLCLYYDFEVPTFHNLTHFELILGSKEYPGNWEYVIRVLQHCPKLQNLIVDEVFRIMPLTEDEDWMDPETVPKCLSSQLKTCLLKDFKGTECRLHFAEFIMLNSKLLCTMTIESSCSIDEKAKHQMLVKLSSYTRGSTMCKLIFV